MIKELVSFFQWLSGVFDDWKKSTEMPLEATVTTNNDEQKTTSFADNFFRKIDELGIFSLYGTVINTPLPYIRQTGVLLMPLIQDMIQNESTEFVEGFLAGLFYGGKVTEMSGELAVQAGAVPADRSAEVRMVHIDTALMILSEYLTEQRNRN